MPDEPRTHYQISFTPKQGMALFVGLLAALGLAYFFGLMTGLSGRDAGEEESAAVEAPAPADAAAATAGSAPAGSTLDEPVSFPPPVTGVPAAAGAATPAPRTVQLFEDRSSSDRAEGEPAPARRVTPAVKTAPGGFRVQVLSVSSSDQAQTQAAQLTRLGFPAVVEPASGPKGTVYRVRVGPFASREEAMRAVDRLTGTGRRGAWIVPPGS